MGFPAPKVIFIKKISEKKDNIKFLEPSFPFQNDIGCMDWSHLQTAHDGLSYR